MVSNFETTIELLCSANKLERDKGVVELEKLLTTESTVAESCVRKCLQRDLINALMGEESSWERKHGCLLAARSLIACQNFNTAFDTDFSTQIKHLSIKYLNDGEARVRLAAGSVLGVLCQKLGPEVYQETKNLVMTSIQCNLERIAGDDDSSLRREIYETAQLMDKLMSGPSFKKRSYGEISELFYDSVGWQNLETSLKALQCMIEGCGNGFILFVDEELLSLIYLNLTHPNRFVRETGFYLISSLFQSVNIDVEKELNNPVVPFGRDVSVHLATGLADNWSQVRLAASVATRHFLLSLPEQARRLFYPHLLPRMCLNRYYAADGVRMYSQETWRQVTGAAGKDLVQLFIEPTVEYYKNSTQSENNAVREAACACIAELATKMPIMSVRPLVFGLLETLLTCFPDQSWPVRDAACLACGNFVMSFPEESRPALGALYPMFYKNLADIIPSVRQGAALSLANVVRAFGESALIDVVSYLQNGLRGMDNQEGGEKLSVSCNELTKTGKRTRDNECAVDAYPSARRKGSADLEPSRPPQPWELADGCVYLLGEISSIKEAHTHVISTVPFLKEAARYKHYPQHVIFLETICKQMPTIAKNLGKRTFSGIVDEFFDDIFYALESENGLTSSAASQCLNQLGTFLGQNILRAKVASYHPRYATALESVIFVAPF